MSSYQMKILGKENKLWKGKKTGQDDDKPFKNKDLMYRRDEDDNMQGIPHDKTIIDIFTWHVNKLSNRWYVKPSPLCWFDYFLFKVYIIDMWFDMYLEWKNGNLSNLWLFVLHC